MLRSREIQVRTVLQLIGRGRRPLPPYGKRLLDLRRRGLVPTSGQVCISVGTWDRVNRNREDAIVLPPHESPQSFDWAFVVGLPTLLLVEELSLETADQLAALLIAAGCAGCAALILPKFGSRCGWKLYQSHFGGTQHAA